MTPSGPNIDFGPDGFFFENNQNRNDQERRRKRDEIG